MAAGTNGKILVAPSNRRPPCRPGLPADWTSSSVLGIAASRKGRGPELRHRTRLPEPTRSRKPSTWRADGQGGLSARTVRYVYTILRSALGDAVRQGRLSVNPTDRSTPPSPSEARPPEMQAWTAPELARFLRWADQQDPDLAMGWRLLA